MARPIVRGFALLLMLSPAVTLAQKGSGPREVVSFRGPEHGPIGTPSPAAGEEAILSVDLTGRESWDFFGSSNNEILTEILGPAAEVTGVGWNLTIQTVAATSWLHEAVAAFYSNHEDGFGFDVAPGVGDFFSGKAAYSSGGILYLADFDIPDLPLGADGGLLIQLWESFDDVPDAVDARYPSGSYDLAFTSGAPVPALPPVGLAILALLILAAATWLLARRIPG